MQRWRGLDAIPAGFASSVVTIGMFDGVHRGHRVILGRAVERARELGVPSVVLTFDPHPAEVVRPGSHPPVLAAPRLKAELMEQVGLDAMLILPFTPVLAQLPAEDFVRSVLFGALHARAIVVGANFRFGRQARGDVPLLLELGAAAGVEVDAVPLVGDARPTSSTAVRECVAAGDMRAAAAMLSRPHRIEGIVVRGDQRGRELGYPTANLQPTPHAAVPADGVYAGWLIHRGERLPAAISIGTNPTFEGTERRIESYVLDASLDLYGAHIGVEFVERLRSTERFDSLEALIAAIDEDVARTRTILASDGA
ncbi:MAG: riboflavin kinase / adenylyltransferase [Frankiaceae bacterium]|jgi:riboflavin kinase/FMN adenylyltransferase|nr:riboflavin kinase / adenylyltransferase [Frankiaceae bacterium]MDQ1726579.1 riboflavin kinase / adenylyltransferase [Frankiaceae bacterium]